MVNVWTERSAKINLAALTFSPVVHDWVMKGRFMSGRVCATGSRPIKYPVPRVEKE